MKTNDVSGRVKVGEVGFTIEFGRPGVGVWFRDIQKMCWALAKAGVSFEKKNPVTSLMSDVATGTLREDILGEKVMSAIRRNQGPRWTAPRRSSGWCGKWKSSSTRWSALGVGTRCDENGEENVVAPILERLGYKLERAKTNIGLGQVTNPGEESSKKEEPVPAMS